MSESAYARLERDDLDRPTLDRICRAARAVGLAPSLSFYPTGEPIRDAAQLALLARFEALLGPPLRMRREVPLPIHGDLRAWDGRITDGTRTASIEGESKLYDAQALARRIGLKSRDDPGAGVVILVVNQTAHNRRVLAAHREVLREQFPLDGGCDRSGAARWNRPVGIRDHPAVTRDVRPRAGGAVASSARSGATVRCPANRTAADLRAFARGPADRTRSASAAVRLFARRTVAPVQGPRARRTQAAAQQRPRGATCTRPTPTIGPCGRRAR